MSRTLLIDLSGIFWAAWHATADQDVSAAFEATITKVATLRSGYDHVAVCCDSPPYWRKSIHPAYKAQRDAPPPQALEQFARTKARLEADGLWLASSPTCEADDVIATLALALSEQGHAVTIASADKDLLQLVDDQARIRVVSLRGDVYAAAQVEEKFGVPPHRMLDLLSLTGDASDNVPGVPGVGPKTAAKLLAEHGSLEAIIAAVDGIPQPKLQASLRDHAPAARLAKRLIALRTDVPIDAAEITAERKVAPLREPDTYAQPDTIDGELDSAPAAQAPAPPPSTPPMPEPATAIVRAAAPAADWSLALEPASLGGAYKLACGLANSRLYSRLPNAEAIWAIIIRGREMGLGALAALDNFHLVEGKPCPHAHLLIARAKAHPDCEWFQFVAGDETFAEYATKNRANPRPTTLRYTLDQARRAGLVKSGGNWEKRPDEMLRKTCAVQLARIEYPDATQGLYSVEEMTEGL
jgi:5'-3' exonuclease